ncbi:hypothetical protein PputGB1_2016 [Pseudomonas putida GB-1]|uniref:Uncharacterized protein n=2 Tax=Pseudomonas TaxID=286 RepID=B0KKL1_PSEPG|nr:hypothetical protein PputGB1_2016 [Pseudomonas putida GB-1]
MTTPEERYMEAIEIALLGVCGITLLLVCLQLVRQGEIWSLLQSDRELEHTARIHRQENSTLHAALRTEREHVSQLQHQIQVLLGLAPEA